MYLQGDFADFLVHHMTSAEGTEDNASILQDLEEVLGSKEELRRRKSQTSESEGRVKRQYSQQLSTLSSRSHVQIFSLTFYF